MGAVDILVNNAGITTDNLFMRMSDEDWQSVIDVNLTATFRLCRAAMRGMMKARWGRIVNISSVVGATGNPGQVNYAASKAGMVGMSKIAGRRSGEPGDHGELRGAGVHRDGDDRQAERRRRRRAILTAVPAGRMGTPEEIAAAVLYLASPGSGLCDRGDAACERRHGDDLTDRRGRRGKGFAMRRGPCYRRAELRRGRGAARPANGRDPTWAGTDKAGAARTKTEERT